LRLLVKLKLLLPVSQHEVARVCWSVLSELSKDTRVPALVTMEDIELGLGDDANCAIQDVIPRWALVSGMTPYGEPTAGVVGLMTGIGTTVMQGKMLV
jgi:hypothetical protein